ncbi:YbaB/EbfC family nucleoid-associated protein [Plantactinospora soyae]|uniref:DNA-binding protein YbaB n=1 Tax=Plantactinospora soyae TaxID=1544732 RepID=A0A927M6T2_9ACTN|nr:YbaB/EbfC family nucleoid-associated protein [Plantactinospora soyae]MBE1485530.1 DNA-binding protein YbaB [Plantactinospora soyae]
MSVRPDDGTEMPPEIAEAIAQLEHQRHEADRIRQAVDQLVVKGASRGNEVVATVRGTGRITEVSIEPEVLRRYDAYDIGVLVTEAVNNAQDRLAKATEARFAPLLAAADRLVSSV